MASPMTTPPSSATVGLLSFALCLFGAGLSAQAHTALEDPTEQLLPRVHCEDSACLDAENALNDGDFSRAAELLLAHAREQADDDEHGLWLVYAAFSFQQDEQWERAADLYAEAASLIEPLQSFLWTRAVDASMTATEGGDQDLIDLAMATDALKAGYRDGHFRLAQIQTDRQGQPDLDVAEQALAIDEPDEVCPFLIDTLSQLDDIDAQLFDLTYGRCIDEDHADELERLQASPSATSRLQRANQLARDVRFEEALAQLDAIDRDDLDTVDQCRADFREARSHFRLRRFQRAEDIYRQIISRCTDDANEDQRVRSLYAVGNRNYQRGRLDEAQSFFTTLFEDYPYRSHADDALFFLARIERAREDGQREREEELLLQALEEYPHEDMIHEMAWEVYEDLFRDGHYQAFIDAVTALPLPDWDKEYFSQGRLEYFVAMAHLRLDRVDEATDYWQLAWVKYPFSFYGYLSRLRMEQNDRQPEDLLAGFDELPRRWFDDDFEHSGAAILASVGHLQGACEVESARLRQREDTSPRDQWRLATLCHHAGEYDKSHNIARRRIDGRPWSMPPQGRLSRWHIAWPDPYGDQLQQATGEFGPQADQQLVHPGLASAIMREESAFIEDIISWAGAVGLMQLMPATAREHDHIIDGQATIENLQQAAINIPIGIDHMASLSRRYEGHPVMITAAYNAGAGRINSWLRRQPNDEIALWVEDIPFLETRNYSKRVIGSYGAYQFLQGDPDFDPRVADPAR